MKNKNKLISKELLSEVLGFKIEEVKSVMDEKLYFNIPEHGDYIDIHKLGNKCKEWLFDTYGLFTDIQYSKFNFSETAVKLYIKPLNASKILYKEIKIPAQDLKISDEVLYVFEICQWIMDNRMQS